MDTYRDSTATFVTKKADNSVALTSKLGVSSAFKTGFQKFDCASSDQGSMKCSAFLPSEDVTECVAGYPRFQAGDTVFAGTYEYTDVGSDGATTPDTWVLTETSKVLESSLHGVVISAATASILASVMF